MSGLRFRVLGSGSSGNATLIEDGATRILIDAGLGPKELAERLLSAGVDPASLSAVFLTHEHGDHARGAASFSRKWGVRLHGTRGTHGACGLEAQTIAGYEVIEATRTRTLGSLAVTAVAVAHDAAEPVAYVVASADSRFGHATDLGTLSSTVAKAFAECDAVLVEANYDPTMLANGPYPWSLKERILSPRGHLSNGDVGRYLGGGLGEACRHVVLAHLSEKNNHPEIARMTAETALAKRGRGGIRVDLTDRDGTGWIEVGRARAPRTPTQLRLW